MKLLITGGAGFIGSALIRHVINNSADIIVNIDKLTYAGNLESLISVSGTHQYVFEKADICDRARLDQIFSAYMPDVVIHLAAESHVDRSISHPAAFIETNIVGTYNLLEAARSYWEKLTGDKRDNFKILHVSTDEVFGALGHDGYFTENTPYQPNSPYSASKASSDHLARSWWHTYGLPVLITNCSNNYGPFQFPEKLIPLMILNGISGKQLPIYGNGTNIRDWLYVDDHAKALYLAVIKGRAGETYNIGSNNEKTNLQIVQAICELLDELAPIPGVKHSSLMTFVKDRPGHDFRYAINANKIERDLGWSPVESFESGLRKTVVWYLENTAWTTNVTSGAYRDWYKKHYTEGDIVSALSINENALC